MKLETLFEKFELFADTPDVVAKIRKLILGLGVSGRLSNDTKSWTDAPLGEVSKLRRGYDLPTQNRRPGSFPIFAANGPVGVHETRMVEGPGVVTGRSGSIGKVHFVNGDFWPLNTALYVEDFFGNDPQFICLLLRSLNLERFSTATAVPTLNRNVVHREMVRVPPLAEQKRIVAKMDELMALCDRLEAQQQERKTRHAALARAALARFADAPTPANLELLFHESYSIPPADLRKSILTIAIKGKLVPQDPNDEPAPALLDQIATHRASLLKEGRRRGTTLVTPIAADGGDFDLPPTWTWVRFGDIMVNRDGERIPVSKEERESKAKTYDYYGASGVIDKIDNYLFDKPLLLVGEDGANLINRSTPIAFIAQGKYWVNNHAHVLDGISEDFLRFIALHINAINLEPYITGTAQPKMNQAKMNSIPIALPPLAEQRRIVAKVDELMSLVDALENQLATARTTGATLVEAVVAELTAKA